MQIKSSAPFSLIGFNITLEKCDVTIAENDCLIVDERVKFIVISAPAFGDSIQETVMVRVVPMCSTWQWQPEVGANVERTSST